MRTDRRWLLLCLLTALAACVGRATPSPPDRPVTVLPAVETVERELAVVAVRASSIESNRPEMRGENAVDRIAQTRWGSSFSQPEWLELDLGRPRACSSVAIDWEDASARRYEIQVSEDASSWRTVFSETRGDGGSDRVSFAPVTARYVRLFCQERATDFGFSLFEIRVFGPVPDDGEPPTAPDGFAAVFAQGAVFLEWQPSPDPDWQSYRVYRRAPDDSEARRLDACPLLEPRFVDETAEPGTNYTYQVTAVDLQGREGAPTAPVTGAMPDSTARRTYPVPACAWRHFLGDIPAACISSSPNRGVALGGFGAGSFMYTISGAFGPFQTFDNALYKPVWLDAAAFHYYERIGAAPATVRCLATDARLKSAWQRLRTGEGVYRALQPKGWVAYSAFRTDVSQKFFSPIIPHDYRAVSLPVAVWSFQLHNPEAETAVVSVMLTFPGVYVGENLKEEHFENTTVKRGAVQGVVLRSRQGLGEWCIATQAGSRATVSCLSSWNARGDGADVWNAFRGEGSWRDTALDASSSAAAIAVRISLAPGETAEIPMVIAWDFPVVRFNSGTEWWKKYTEYFDRKGDNSFAIASEALARRDVWEERVDAWQRPVIECAAYPDWLKGAAFNELYYNQFGGSFYEAGLKSGHEREFMGLHEEDHKHFVMESPVYTSANTLDVRHYASVEFARFWPEIERDTLRVFADGTLHYKFLRPVPVGLVPHDVGDPKKCDPFFEFDVYRHDLPDMLYWKDLSPKFVQQCWRHYRLSRDREFLRYVWPACKAVFRFMKSTDADGDRLSDNNGSDNTYDNWGLHGTSLLCGGLWVGALECLEQMAVELNDPLLAEIRSWLKEARANLDRELWMEEKGYYRMDTRGKHPTAIMSDGLNGQLYCRRYGLADILPAERMARHLRRIFELCVKPLKDYNGDGVGDLGAINAIEENGTMLGTLQSDEVWTGSTYFLAALMVDAGMRDEALATGYGVYFNTYVNRETAFWFNTPESWRIPTLAPRPANPEQYQRPRAVWELLLALHDPYRSPAAQGR